MGCVHPSAPFDAVVIPPESASLSACYIGCTAGADCTLHNGNDAVLDDEHRCVTVYDPDHLAAWLTDDPSHAARLLARLTPPQRLCQALEHTRWLMRHGATTALDEVLSDWQRRTFLEQSGASDTDPATAMSLASPARALRLAADPFSTAALLAALPITQRVAAAYEHVDWLRAQGLPRSLDEVLSDWQALATYAASSAPGRDAPLELDRASDLPANECDAGSAAAGITGHAAGCCFYLHPDGALSLKRRAAPDLEPLAIELSSAELIALHILFDVLNLDALLARLAARQR